MLLHGACGLTRLAMFGGSTAEAYDKAREEITKRKLTGLNKADFLFLTEDGLNDFEKERRRRHRGPLGIQLPGPQLRDDQLRRPRGRLLRKEMPDGLTQANRDEILEKVQKYVKKKKVKKVKSMEALWYPRPRELHLGQGQLRVRRQNQGQGIRRFLLEVQATLLQPAGEGDQQDHQKALAPPKPRHERGLLARGPRSFYVIAMTALARLSIAADDLAGARLLPVLRDHGLVDAGPCLRPAPAPSYRRLFAVESLARLDTVERALHNDSAWRRALEELGRQKIDGADAAWALDLYRRPPTTPHHRSRSRHPSRPVAQLRPPGRLADGDGLQPVPRQSGRLWFATFEGGAGYYDGAHFFICYTRQRAERRLKIRKFSRTGAATCGS